VIGVVERADLGLLGRRVALARLDLREAADGIRRGPDGVVELPVDLGACSQGTARSFGRSGAARSLQLPADAARRARAGTSRTACGALSEVQLKLQQERVFGAARLAVELDRVRVVGVQ
jgi:hypothetical protein